MKAIAALEADAAAYYMLERPWNIIESVNRRLEARIGAGVLEVNRPTVADLIVTCEF